MRNHACTSHSESIRAGKVRAHNITFLFIIFFSFFFLESQAKESPFELFHEANISYKEKDYAKAISLYDSIVHMGYVSSDLFFNLGNAYYKTGAIAPAILNYERAKKLDPGNEDIEFNLKIVNLRVADRIEPVPELFFLKWVKNFVIRQSSDGWARLSIILIWVAFIFGAAVLMIGNAGVRRLSFLFAVIALICSLIFTFLSYNQYQFQKSSQAAIVFVTNAYIKSAPASDSADLFILREGVKVDIMETDGSWQRIKLADGKVGWIEKSQVVEI